MLKSKNLLFALFHTNNKITTSRFSSFTTTSAINHHRGQFHTYNLLKNQNNQHSSDLSNILREYAGLNKKELDLFEQLNLDETDLEELEGQISETSYQLAMERFHRIVNHKCVFIERDESVDLSKFSIKLVEFASSKVPIRSNTSNTTVNQQDKSPNRQKEEQAAAEEPENVKSTLDQAPQQQESIKVTNPQETKEKTETVPAPEQSPTVQETIVEEEPSSISAVAQDQVIIEEELHEEEQHEETISTVKESLFQLPTESYETWNKETTLNVMKGVIRKGGAGMKAKQIQCLQRFNIDGRVLESVKFSLETDTKEVVSANLMKQLSIPNHKPTPSIISKIIDWVEKHSSA